MLRHSLIILILASMLRPCLSSAGDGSRIFRDCLYSCLYIQCNFSENYLHNLNKTRVYFPRNLSLPERLITWKCKDECKYHCMWWTLDAYRAAGISPKQFYGRWPQIRLLGAQEPASALFSVLNLVTQLLSLRSFLLQVPPQTPLFLLWLLYALAGINAWIWSTVFHVYDTDFTEKMDYTSAFTYVGCFFMVTLARITRKRWRWTRIGLLCVALQVIISHLLDLLLMPSIDYQANMRANLILGVLTILGWLVGVPESSCVDETWISACRVMQASVLYIGAAATLELFDFPAIWWLFDAHSLWHAATIPVPLFIFSFAIKDSRELRKLEIAKRKRSSSILLISQKLYI